MRDGVVIKTDEVTKDLVEDDIARLMVGKELDYNDIYIEREIGEEIIRTEHLSREREFEDINFHVNKGEIVGITGLLGDGRFELMNTVFGQNKEYQGDIFVRGNKIKMNNIQFDLRKGIGGVINGFKGIPNVVVGAASSINRGCDAMIDFFMAAPDMAFNAIKNGFNSIKNGFINFIPNCKKAIDTIKTLNITMSLNPVGLVVGAFAVGAFMIYKYWQPISAFFKGMFTGIKQGLAPLQPTFIAIGNAIKPAINWIKAFFAPVQNEGKEVKNWGIKFGNGIAWGITKMVEAAKWLKELITLGGRLKLFPSSGNSENTKVDGSHANGLDNVPYDGYIAKVHKNEADDNLGL